MKLKTKVLLLAIAIHAIFIYILSQLYTVNRNAFLIAEASVFISLILTYLLYRAVSRPFDTISSGIASLKDKDFSAKLNKTGHREMDELIYVYNLMIEQLRQERLLQVEKSSFLEKLIEASPSGIIIFGFDGSIASINPAAEEIVGLQRSAILGKPINQVSGRLPELLSQLETNAPKVVNLNGIKSYKCHKATFTDQGYTRTFITIEELTAEIYTKEKNAYEKVIKMMSHEVNNSIGAINSLLNSCLNYKHQLNDEDQEDYMTALAISINRNNGLSDLMSNFARVIRIPEPVRHQIELISVLRSVALLMEPEARKKEVNWQWETDAASFETFADAQQLEQVFINILKNAIEAVNPSGTIRIQTCSSTKSISIANTGSPITNEVSQQLFSPFFSTKKNGQGIGLMLTREILYNHNFKFSLENTEEWTEFKIHVH
ncbi:PAS domain S-box-containing protein [Pedobacter steynii]|uniref:histidine kinase n=1 Tax=Pedobacter steynii TaxID=430522 RepID=A0A1G9L231_9SPHI|nr:ATP-binding protein [Pedobacter steynii]NQX38706.1 PAS domain S-box protein [Pedobacter steynii]SDL56001.1 PAS domain S-box-containing protein [Pedobacter steynii]